MIDGTFSLHWRWRKLGPLLMLASLCGCNEPAAPNDGGVSPYRSDWFYRWGDSPKSSDGVFAWTKPDVMTDWSPMLAMGSPKDRNGQKDLWVHTRLVGEPAQDPVLYLRGVDQIFEAYLDGQYVYRFGEFEGNNAYKFLGYKAHYIPIGNDYQGKVLSLRIHSDHVNIGLFGEPLIGARAAIMNYAIRRDLPTLALGVVMVSIGLFVFLLFLARRKQHGYLTYSLLATTIGLYFTAVSPTRQLLIDAPFAWLHIELFSLYLLSGLLAAYVEHVFGKGPWRITQWLKRAFFLYTALAAIAVGTGLVPVLKTLLPAQLLLLFTTFSLTAQTVRGAFAGLLEARIFGVGFVVAAIAGAYDILGAMGILSRANVPVGHLGIFVFTLSLGLILARRFLEVEERLGQYSTVLGLSLASARVLEPGQQAQVALDELLRLLKAKRALLFLSVPEGQTRAGDLELRAMRDLSLPSANTRESSVSTDGFSLRTDVVERVRTQRKPLITSNSDRGKRRSAMAAPLLIRDELVGVVYLEADDSRRPFSDADLAVLLGLGTQLSITIVSTRSVRLELQTALQKNRIEQQGALLDAASRLARGDVETPILVEKDSDLADLGSALDAMRVDVRAKIKMLETKNSEVQVLNDELRRKIEERTMTLLSALLDDSVNAPLPRLKHGAMIGDRYRVDRKLGEGAMGVVYDVERTADGKHLAIKLLSTTKDKPALVRFMREANLLARLDHPNLVSIFDVDVTPEGHIYLVMEYFAGKTLEKFRNQDLRWNLLALQQMAEGLAAVHASGIVHRDLKPANVLVAVNDDGDPDVKLADFGISTLAVDDDATMGAPAPPNREPMDSSDDEVRTAIFDKLPSEPKSAREKANRSEPGGMNMNVTSTGVLVGTPSYMAPELGSKEKARRPSSDIFSLGIMAYELMVGQRPYPVPPVYIVASGNPLELPTGLRKVAKLSKTMAEFFERCLAQDPTLRPTAPEIADAIRADLNRADGGTYRMRDAAHLKPRSM